jgi:hypothetical protein
VAHDIKWVHLNCMNLQLHARKIITVPYTGTCRRSALCSVGVLPTHILHQSITGTDIYLCVAEQEDYEFQHMVSGSCLLLVDSPALRQALLTPWLRCVLTEDCINPIGAQSTGEITIYGPSTLPG